MVLNWNPAAPPRPGEAAWGVAPGQSHDSAWLTGRGTATGHWAGWPGGQGPLAPYWVRGVNQSYRWFEPDVREFYEDNPAQAYQGFLDYGFGDRQRPLLDYARNYYGRAYAAALRGEEGAQTAAPGQVTPPTNGAHWVDYLTPDLVYTIRQSFNMQSASNRGVVNMFMPWGRTANG